MQHIHSAAVLWPLPTTCLIMAGFLCVTSLDFAKSCSSGRRDVLSQACLSWCLQAPAHNELPEGSQEYKERLSSFGWVLTGCVIPGWGSARTVGGKAV